MMIVIKTIEPIVTLEDMVMLIMVDGLLLHPPAAALIKWHSAANV